MNAPRYHLITYGCQMNKNDTERIARLLSDLGFKETDVEEDADLILLNTCSVRQTAENRVYGKMKDFIDLKSRRPEVIVAITGCMAGRDKNGELRRRLFAADLFFPTSEMVKLPRWIAELRPELVNTTDAITDYLKISPLRSPSAQAFVSIQTGCNKFCTYCVVPYARGLERNRPTSDVIAEIKNCAERGVKEITFLGQTVNSYRASDPESFSRANPYVASAEKQGRFWNHFAALLWEANETQGIERVNWTAPHPNSMTDDVIDALALPKQVNFLHLPVQSGSNDVLFRMNRKYTREDFLRVIEKVNAARPGIAIGTDIIVGFSGETEKDFEDTVSLYREVDFDISYTAQYSPRTGTLANKLFADDVSREEKRQRWDFMQTLMKEITLRKNQALVGKTVSVLVDRVENGWAIGNSSEMKVCKFKCSDPGIIGTIVAVTVETALEWQLLSYPVSCAS